MEENGGIGKHNETPPEDFRTELQEEKQRRLAFFKIWPQRDEILKKMKEMQKYYLIYLYLAIAIANAFYVIY